MTRTRGKRAKFVEQGGSNDDGVGDDSFVAFLRRHWAWVTACALFSALVGVVIVLNYEALLHHTATIIVEAAHDRHDLHGLQTRDGGNGAAPAPTVPPASADSIGLIERRAELNSLQLSLAERERRLHNESMARRLDQVKALFDIPRVLIYEVLDVENRSLVPSVFMACFPPPDWICTDAVLRHGQYEGYLQKYQLLPQLERFPRADLLFVDGGANIGLYTTFVASKGYRTVSFEANPDTFRYLMANVMINGLNERVELINQGLGEQAEVKKIGSWPRNYGASSFNLEFGQPVQVQPLQAHWRVREHCLAGRPVVMKLDVEGFEMKVFRGSEWLWASGCIKSFQVELLEHFHNVNEIDAFTALLAAYNYQMTNPSSDRHYLYNDAAVENRPAVRQALANLAQFVGWQARWAQVQQDEDQFLIPKAPK